jgi:membrane protein
MREYEPIRIRPLTLRGVFGITWKVFGRRLGALVGYGFLYLLIVLLVVGVSVLPTLLPLLSQPDFHPSEAEVLRIVSGSLMTVMLTLLGSLLLALLVAPVYSGTLYGEMSARIYGSASSVGLMLKRSKYSLKRFFTTTLCYMLAAFAIAFVVNILSSVLVTFVTLFTALGALPSLLSSGAFHAGAGMIVPVVLGVLLLLVIELAGMSFLLFVYPIAVNEPVKNFAAVKRSFQLVWKRFGRVLGCELIVLGVAFLAALLIILCFALALSLASAAAAVLGVLATLGYAAFVLFLGPYEAALATVLYFDSRVRLEGTAWLGEPEQPQESAQPDPAWQEPVQQPGDGSPEA